MDAIVVKIEARTGRLAWATRTGGSAWDAAGDITVARDGSIGSSAANSSFVGVLTRGSHSPLLPWILALRMNPPKPT